MNRLKLISSIKNRFSPHAVLSPEEEQKGLKAIVWDGILSQAMGSLQGGAFLAAFALALGATNFEIGILAAIPFFAQISQILAVYLVETVRNRKAIVVIFAVCGRLVWLVIIFIPILFLGKQGITLLMLAVFSSSVLGAIAGNSWFSMVRDLVPEKTMGKLFSQRAMLGTGFAIALTLLGGYFIDSWKSGHNEIYGYSIIFAFGLILGLIGASFLLKIPELEMKGEIGASLPKLLSQPFADRNFRNLIIFASFWNFAINLAAPFFTIYMLRRLGLDLFLVTILIMISQVTNLLFVRVWGRLADRFSNKSVLSVSGTLFLVAIIAWPFTTMPEKYFLTIPLLVLIHVLSGISLAGVGLASGNIILKLSPRGQASAYIASHGLLSNIVAASAPLLGGILADFFAVRGLSFTFSWSGPAKELMLYALSFKELDFLFFFAFVVGLYSLHRLTRVNEEGEVEEKIVMQELMSEVTGGTKSLSSVGGLRNLTIFPLHLVSGALRTRSKAGNTNEGNKPP
ncbi:MAG: MFS transporter [Chloroflexota bacterium]|nr:MFS transporter [Chloroflexota bacterium]